MEKSESIKNIAEALCKFQRDVEIIEKDGTNPHFHSKFASLDNIIQTIMPSMVTHDLSFVQFPDGDGLTTMVMHKSGEWLSSTAKLIIEKQTPQGQGSALTYLRRYALSGALGLSTETDDDGNAASKPVPTRKVQDSLNPPQPVPPKQVADKREAQKELVKKLCDEKSEVPLLGPTDYKTFVEKKTGLKLEAENLDKIIERLSAN